MNPTISVILNTARSGYAMRGFPDIHHFRFTIDALRRQSYKDFEFIISDYIYDKRNFDWSSMRKTGFPIYHVPVRHSWFVNNNYVAISACKNNGIIHSEGEILLFLDDCCTFEGNFLSRIVEIYKTKRMFPNPWHKKEIGSELSYDGNGKPVIDSRYVLFDRLGSDEIVNNFSMYGYSSMSLQAALKVNGFDEMFDGSRQLEDIDMGERLKAAGFKISMHRHLFIVEQEHTMQGRFKINPEHPELPEDVVQFKENLKCNGPFFYIKKDRTGPDYYIANRRQLNPEESKKIKPCFMKEGKHCKSSGMDCNWIDKPHMMSQESNIYLSGLPVFSLLSMRNETLKTKQSFKVKE